MAAQIQKHIGNLLDVESGILVHGCNAQGVMGSGVALGVKKKFPNVYGAYREAFLDRELRVGRIFPVQVSREENGAPKLVVVNAITQEYYGTDRRHVDYDGLKRCFKDIAVFANAHGIKDIHFPLIGCGLAGGEWSVVAPIIEETLDGLNAHLWVLE